MRERVQRLLSEFLVIVLGVLVALGVDQWRQGLDDDRLERQYAVRLLADLSADTADYNRLLNGAFVVKREFLEALSRGEVPNTASSEAELLEHLDQSTWGGVVEATDAAFREMLATGRINLLEDEELRGDLANYYADQQFLAERYFASAGDYDRIVAEAVPGSIRFGYHVGEEPPEGEVVRALQTLLRHPGLAEAVNAELAYGGGLVQWHGSLQRRALGLIDRLEAGYAN